MGILDVFLLQHTNEGGYVDIERRDQFSQYFYKYIVRHAVMRSCFVSKLDSDSMEQFIIQS
jgi:hypothetical protein